MIQTCRALCAVLILILSHNAFAQKTPKAPGVPNNPVSVSKIESDLIAQDKKNAVLRAAGFSEQLLALNNVQVKVWAVARLADLLWKEDEHYARQLFSKALDLCPLKSGNTSTETQVVDRMRRDVINIIARRDPNWAKRLIDADSANQADDEDRAAERMDANFNAAYNLLKTEPDKAINFAEQSLRDGVPPDMYSLLILLRRKDERAANALFLKTLDQLLMQPVVGVDTLLSLGTYIFTSPEFDPDDPDIADTTRVVGVGRLLLYDITADRPNVPREIVRAYLATAVRILARQIPIANRPAYYAAARLLLPKTVKFAPELTQTVAVVMQGLSPDVPPELTLDAAYANFEVAAPKELSETIKDIEKEKSEQRRDEKYFVLLADLWRKSEFASARTLNAKISDKEASAQLKTLIDFKEAAEKLERGKEIGAVEEMARKLPKGIERAQLWLGIARARAKAKESQQSSEAINSALEAAASVSDARRPYLILIAASELAQIDPLRSQATLAEAVRQLNSQTQESLAAVSWEQRVEVGRLWRYFPLRVAGIQSDFRLNLAPLMKVDTEGTIEAVKRLASEGQLAPALLAVAAALLK